MFAVTLLAFVSAGTSVGCATSSDQAKSGAAGSIDTPTGVLDRYTDVVDISGFYDFAATTLSGDQITGTDYQDKQLALWFWAPW